MGQKATRFIIFSIMVLFFISWTALLYHYSPEEIINFVGVENAYLLAFFVCFLGGVSILIPIPYYLIIITLGAGGANPLLLGILGGLGQATGDTTSYALGYSGKKVVPKKLQILFNKLFKWLSTKPQWVTFVSLMTYSATMPTPNDLLVIPLGLAHYPYSKTIIPLGIGNIIFNTAMACIGYYGLSLFF